MNKVELVIRCVVDVDGVPQQLQLSGPINNLLLCYGLLELARDSLQQRSGMGKAVDQRIAVPHLVLGRE